MSKPATYIHTAPRIKSVHFLKGKIVLYLKDGRTVIIPENRFPEIERLTPQQKRKHKTLAGMGLMFEAIDTVFHISDFLGNSSNDFPDTPARRSLAKAGSYAVAGSSKLLPAKEPTVKYGKRAAKKQGK